MARISVPEKLRRIVTFLWGLRNRKARRQLQAYGLTTPELEHVWSLMTQATQRALSAEPKLSESELGGVLNELDVWENRWFPIAKATLSARFPKVAEAVFLNLGQASGRDVLLTVQTFLDRVEPLADAPAESSEAQAFALLQTRGLTGDVRQTARGLLAQVHGIDMSDVAEEPEDNVDEIVDELWTWYQEWAAIARVVIPEKYLRIQLGVSNPSTSDDEADA